MHIPVLLCGFLCGMPCGTLVGAVAPILRSLIFTRPVLYPTALTMMFELATYGFLAGLLYRLLPKKPLSVYVSLLGAMLGGRIVGGLAQLVLLSLNGKGMTGAYFFTEYFVNAWPGMVLQVILIPPVVIAMRHSKLMRDQ